MLTKEQAEEIFHALKTLPHDKVMEVRDFALFLKGRYGRDENVGYSDNWSEEDINDLSKAVWQYAEQAVPWVS